MGGLQNAYCGNNDNTRVELTRGIDEIAGIDTRHDATHAITIIDDVNAELEKITRLRFIYLFVSLAYTFKRHE